MTDWNAVFDAALARIFAAIDLRCALELERMRGGKSYRRSIGQRYRRRAP